MIPMRPAHCQGCGRTGVVPQPRKTKPAWCRCKGTPGPLVAPPGVVIRHVFETPEAAELRERGRLLGNAYIEARDALCGRWVRCGRGWRELRRGTPKRDRLERAFAAARRRLLALQRECPHPTRSMHNTEACDVCHALVSRRAAA